jgi:hypothetical protein
LVWFHQLEINIRGDAKYLQRLIQHLAVLASDTYTARKPGVVLKPQNDRRKLDRLWARSEDNGDFHAKFTLIS